MWSFLKPFYKSLQHLEEVLKWFHLSEVNLFVNPYYWQEHLTYLQNVWYAMACSTMESIAAGHACNVVKVLKLVDQVGMHGHSHLMKKTQKDQKELSKIFMIMLQKP